MSLFKLIRDRSTREGDCWIWTQGLSCSGVPAARFGGPWRTVRRLIAMEAGPVHKRRTMVPVCGERLCVNPAHLQSMTLSEMQRRSAAQGNHSRPDKRAKVAAAMRAKSMLTVDAVNQIRNSDTLLTVEVARWGVSTSTISCIRRGKRWAAIGGIF